MTSSLIQPVASSLINVISGKGQEGGVLPLLALPLMIKVLGKGVRRAEKRCNKMDKIFYFCFSLYAISRLLSISITCLGLIVFFSRENYLEQKMS